MQCSVSVHLYILIYDTTIVGTNCEVLDYPYDDDLLYRKYDGALVFIAPSSCLFIRPW